VKAELKRDPNGKGKYLRASTFCGERKNMFKRAMTESEAAMVNEVVEFVRGGHTGVEVKDATHLFAVMRCALEIAEALEDEVNPFILVCGALLHDIGRTVTGPELHAIEGARIAEGFLRKIGAGNAIAMRVKQIVLSHTPMSESLPVTVEEKIVFDADIVTGLGYIGFVELLMGKNGRFERILRSTIEKARSSYGALHYVKSKEMAREALEETEFLIEVLEDRLAERVKEASSLEVTDIGIPVVGKESCLQDI
jgi:uncharacterized protein